MNLFKTVKRLVLIAIGAAIMAFGIVNFAMPSGLASGGVTGITLILYNLWGISPALSTLLINIPLHIVYFKFTSRPVFFLTIYGTACLYAFLSIFEAMGPMIENLQNDLILAAICLGFTIGLGTGMILRQEATTGGAIIVAKLLKDIFNVPITKTFLIFDATVIIASLLLFIDITVGIYSLIGLYISIVVMNKLQEGFVSGYKVLIFSKKYKKIGESIQQNLKRGATYLHGTGGYSKEEKDVLLVLIDSKQLIRLKNIVNEIDPQSFVSVSHTYETLGEGFTFEKNVVSEKEVG